MPTKPTAINGWQAVHTELRRRLSARIWAPGDYLPSETELAAEFGCARATVNRAMRELTDAGLLERRRKAGTRVITNPVRRATLDIPIIREEVERRGASWHYQMIEQKTVLPPAVIASRLSLPSSASAMHICGLHLSDRQPFVLEDRWINIEAVPAISGADLNKLSPNEWLVQHAPFTHGEYSLSAANANADEVKLLGVTKGAALMIIDRITFNESQVITCVRLAYAPGYRVQTTL